jgi:ribosome assembly protein YihI (activator of Der GTPase)
MDIIMSNELENLKKDIELIKNQITSIENKVDTILEFMNNLSIMVMEDEEDYDDDEYDTDLSWLPEEDEWNNHEDES